MKRLALVGLKTCERCHQAVAYLMTEDGEHTVGIALDTGNARELSRNDQEPEEKQDSERISRGSYMRAHLNGKLW